MTKKWWQILTRPRWGTVLVLAIMGNTSFAQAGTSEVYNEQLRVLMDEQAPTRQDLAFDTGGWLNLGFFDYDDALAARRRTLLQLQLRGWATMNIKDTHTFYVRGLFDQNYWNRGSDPDGGWNHSRGTVERAWYRLNVSRLMGKDDTNPFQLKAGRDFQTLGNSFVLSLPLDMLHLRADIDNWQISAFGGQTIHRSPNIDHSAALYNRQDRVIVGTEIAYNGFSRHRPFAYLLGNWDQTDPITPSATQSYQYDSRYLGVGSRGTLGNDQLLYGVELVGQWGSTYSNTAVSSANQRDSIEAFGFDALLEYLFRCATQPKVMLEYMVGSGDSDRTTSAVATAGGNTLGTHDRAFNAFGFRDTGIAFSPSISNLHIFTSGITLFPLEDRSWANKLETGAKVFAYYKDRQRGAISDTTATATSSYVGFEWDLFCNWRFASDLAWTARYGRFHPGDAYNGGTKSARDYFYTGAVLSF